MILLLLLILAAQTTATTVTTDVFPDDPGKNHYLVEYQTAFFSGNYPQVFEQCAKVLNDPSGKMKFNEYVEERPFGGQPVAHHYIFSDPASLISPPPFRKYVHFLRTATNGSYGVTEFITEPWTLSLNGNDGWQYPQTDDPYHLDIYTPGGYQFQKLIVLPIGGGDPYIEFQAGEMGPAMMILHEDDNTPQANNTQTLQLHAKWNLISWHIVPVGDPGEEILMPDILPTGPEEWFTLKGGQLYKYDVDWRTYYPQSGTGGWQWLLDHAYIISLNQPHTWLYENRPLVVKDTIEIRPEADWDDFFGNPDANRWFFMGYEGDGYTKLASVPNTRTNIGDPALYDFEGPFHWLIWNRSDQGYPSGWGPRVLKIVRTMDGKVYIPSLTDPPRYTIDQIGMLQPGNGYVMGFECAENDTFIFHGWNDYPTWENNNYVGPGPAGPQNQIASTGHFQFTSGTQWFYPIVIDTIDLQATPLQVGDEIGIFDGDLCVGAASYPDSFPMVINAWKDDISTEQEIDGYMPDNPMTFVWYDASQNSAAELILPPGIQTQADDPVAPTHSGFGRGFYGSRSFTSGPGTAMQLPLKFHIGQNYPNPFNSQTIIPLELPQRSRVEVELFNVRGQTLGRMYEGIENAGWPKIHWDASHLGSGIYFCRVTAVGLERSGNYTEARKIVLIK